MLKPHCLTATAALSDNLLFGAECEFYDLFTYFLGRFYHEPGTVAVTNGIKVSVATAFVPAASSIAPPQFSHAYRITYVVATFLSILLTLQPELRI